MKYEFEIPYEIKTCQTCPFMRLCKGGTRCAFAPYGEQRSIRYGTCPLRVAGWHTGTPTEEGWYLVAYIHKEKVTYRAVRYYFDKDLSMEFLESEGGIPYIDIWKPMAYMPIPSFKGEEVNG